MAEYIMWTVFTWTFKGILCTCRFLWICPYNAIKFLPREKHIPEDKSQQPKRVGSESKGIATIPGSPDHTTALQKRLTKTEKEILSLKTRIACERASWERRFAELQRNQEELRNQLSCSGATYGFCYSLMLQVFEKTLEETIRQLEITNKASVNVLCGRKLRLHPLLLVSKAGGLVRVGSCDGESGVDNGEVFDECSSGLHRHRRSEVSSRSDSYACSLSGSQLSLSSSALSSRLASSSSSASSVRSWRTSQGPHRVFVPHSPMDLQLGHQVRIMLPSGRISTGTIRFLGHLQGEADLHLGVELQTPDPGLRDGRHKGHSYFECKPGYGAFVPFHKLLMAWE